MAVPRVAVLVVTHNTLRLGHAADLVDSLSAVVFPSDEWTILVGDNASDDGTAAYLADRLPRATVLRFKTNLGFAEANNRLAEQARALGATSAYLLNHDCSVDPHFLERAIEVLDADPTIGTVQSRILLKQDPARLNTIGNAIQFLGFGFSLGSGAPGSRYPRETWDRSDIAYASGAGMLLRLKLVEQLGLFEPDLFMYHEDLDFGWQVRLAGLRNVAAYDSVVHHQYEFTKSPSKYYYLERNRLLVLLENYRLPTLLLLLPAWLAFELGLLAFAWRRGFWREKWRAYAYFASWSSWRALLGRRRRKQRRRVASDRRLLACMHGTIESPEIDNWLLRRVANPCLRAYHWALCRVVFW